MLQSFDVNVQFVLSGHGTANEKFMELMGLVNNEKSVIISTIRRNRAKDALEALEEKFKTVKNGKGIAYTVPMSSTIGVAIYQFLSNTFSFAIEELGLWLMVDILGFSEFKPQILGIVISGQLIAKMILAIIVIVLNYFFSKFIIFHSKKPTEPSPCEKADDSEEISRA